MDWRTVGIGIVVLGVVLAGILSIRGEGEPSPFAGYQRTGMMMDSDRMFIEEMIPHHQDAVDMGEMALVKAEHPELRRLAENIIRDQTREINLMRGWYRTWYGTDVPEYRSLQGGGRGMMGHSAGMGGRGMGETMTDLGRLANATQFDREFIEQMIPHHRMAIMMGRMVTQNAAHQEIRDLGSSIISNQSAEVEQMLVWYRTWYGTERPL